jgi:hypothetical protein
LSVVCLTGWERQRTSALASNKSLCEGGHARVKECQEDYMIVLGVILLILGLLLDIGILWTIGIIVLIVGIIFFVLGQMGRAVGGRKYWF